MSMALACCLICVQIVDSRCRPAPSHTALSSRGHDVHHAQPDDLRYPWICWICWICESVKSEMLATENMGPSIHRPGYLGT
jgi:hypothetical protein